MNRQDWLGILFAGVIFGSIEFFLGTFDWANLLLATIVIVGILNIIRIIKK